MNLGIITGREIKKNRDGNADRIILQVEMLAGDVRTVELISQSGENTNPADECRVVVVDLAKGYKGGIAVTDDLTPEVDAGEKELYSTDNPATTKLARLKLNSSSEIELNGNSDYAVSWTDLNTVLQALVTAINAAFATKADAAGANPGLTLDLSSAKVLTVRLP
jgi:hypothetical protein